MAILGTLWRHKIASGILIVLTLAGCVGVVFKVPPTYTASGSYLLIRPPESADETTGKTTLTRAGLRTDNPYLRFSDPSVITNVLARKVMEDSNVKKLVDQGADPRFEALPSNKFGFTSPIIEVDATADSADAAISTVEIVGKSVIAQLKAMQTAENVDPRFWFTTRVVDLPDQATRKSSGVLRTLLGVAGLGGIVLMIMVAIFQLRDRKKFLAEHPELALQQQLAAAGAGPGLQPRAPGIPAPAQRPPDRWAEPPGQPAQRPAGRPAPRPEGRPAGQPQQNGYPNGQPGRPAPVGPSNGAYRNGAPHNGNGQHPNGQHSNGAQRDPRAPKQQRFAAPERPGQGQPPGRGQASGQPVARPSADAWPAGGAWPSDARPEGRPAAGQGGRQPGTPGDRQAFWDQPGDRSRRGPRARSDQPNPPPKV